MINRNLIRIRVVQIVYSWYQNKNKDLLTLEKELLFGLRKSYDLYFYLLLIMIEITKAHEMRVETKRNKFLPSKEDLNPNMKLIDNRFIKQLQGNREFNSYLNERPMSWEEHDSFIKNLLDNILDSDVYKEYANSNENDYDNDKEFWRKAFKDFICNNDTLDEILEDESIYWNDDIAIVQSFVLKSIRQFRAESGELQKMLPMFRNEEDRDFALKLLHNTVQNEKEYRDLIEKHSDGWDFDRMAFMDLIIMQVTLAEIYTFDDIPVSVSLNEYIELAKSYSTPKSSTFINGILDAAVSDLRNQNIIFKN